MALRRPFIRFACNARQAMLPTGSQVWTSSRRQGRRQIGKRGTQAQRSTIMFHVKPGVDCAQRPVQRASATSAEDTPFSHSPVHRVPLREPGEDLKRSDAAGLPSVALTRAARLLQGDTGELASGGPDTNRLSSSARGNANGEVDAGTTRIHNATYHQVPIAFLGFT